MVRSTRSAQHQAFSSNGSLIGHTFLWHIKLRNTSIVVTSVLVHEGEHLLVVHSCALTWDVVCVEFTGVSLWVVDSSVQLAVSCITAVLGTRQFSAVSEVCSRVNSTVGYCVDLSLICWVSIYKAVPLVISHELASSGWVKFNGDIQTIPSLQEEWLLHLLIHGINE